MIVIFGLQDREVCPGESGVALSSVSLNLADHYRHAFRDSSPPSPPFPTFLELNKTRNSKLLFVLVRRDIKNHACYISLHAFSRLPVFCNA